MSLAERLRTHRVVAVVRRPEYGDVDALVDALASGGVEAIEFTFTGHDADLAIAATKRRCPGLTVGAGTVEDREQLDRAIAAGADFAVSPVLDPELLAYAQGTITLVPGVLTPTELARAWRLGCGVVKIFPARIGGPDHIRDLLSVRPGVALLPTGGIAPDEVGAYLEAGAVAVGLGTSLLGDGRTSMAEIEARAREARSQLPAKTNRRQG
jgi:2-dehydro-3-deoxyphosphogluconate aldolase/(4S)-4-hydroxy-2-oxoglutarate aldolase